MPRLINGAGVSTDDFRPRDEGPEAPAGSMAGAWSTWLNAAALSDAPFSRVFRVDRQPRLPPDTDTDPRSAHRG